MAQQAISPSQSSTTPQVAPDKTIVCCQNLKKVSASELREKIKKEGSITLYFADEDKFVTFPKGTLSIAGRMGEEY